MTSEHSLLHQLHGLSFKCLLLLRANRRILGSVRLMLWISYRKCFLWHHAIRFHGPVERIATRVLPHRKRLDNVDAEFFLPCSQLLNLIFPSHKNEVKSCSKIRYPAHARVVPFPVNRTLRIFSCFLLANNTLKPVSCLR